MVIAGNVFKLAESLSLAELADRLGSYRVEEPFKEDDYKRAYFDPFFL